MTVPAPAAWDASAGPDAVPAAAGLPVVTLEVVRDFRLSASEDAQALALLGLWKLRPRAARRKAAYPWRAQVAKPEFRPQTVVPVLKLERSDAPQVLRDESE